MHFMKLRSNLLSFGSGDRPDNAQATTSVERPRTDLIEPALPGDASTRENGMAVTIGGSALAFGESTLAQGDIFNHMVDTGPATIAYGFAEFEAFAQSADGTSPLAVADTAVTATGADILFTTSVDLGSNLGNGQAYASSGTKFLAIDFDHWDPPGGTIEIDFSTNIHIDLPHIFDWQALDTPNKATRDDRSTDNPEVTSDLPDIPNGVSGLPTANVANIQAGAVADGPNSFAATIADTVAIENAFSLAGGAATTALSLRASDRPEPQDASAISSGVPGPSPGNVANDRADVAVECPYGVAASSTNPVAVENAFSLTGSGAPNAIA